MRIVLLALLLSACHAANDARQSARDTAATAAPASADTASAGIRACELLSADDVARITGVAFDIGVTTNDYAGDSQCRFGRTGGSSDGVMVSLHAHGDLENYRNVPGSTAIDGVGDGAVWNAGTAQLAVRHGAAVFSISFLTPPAKQQWAVQLARSALTKLARTN